MGERFSPRTGANSIYRVAPHGVLASLAILLCGWLMVTFHIFTLSPSDERHGFGLPLVPLETSDNLRSLSCLKFGGPMDKTAQEEMVYWSDIPSDANPSFFRSPFRFHGDMVEQGDKFMTAELGGGWNNIRMGLETSIVLAHGLGRTLVLPPMQSFYLMEDSQDKQRNQFSLNDFYDLLDRVVVEQRQNVRIIPMDIFLSEVAMKGWLVNKWTHKTEFPPENRTQWDGFHDLGELWKYLRRCGISRPEWKVSESIIVIPSDKNSANEAMNDLSEALSSHSKQQWKPHKTDRGFTVDAPPRTRISELLARKVDRIVSIDAETDSALLLHHTNVFANFYSFVFFQDWKRDLWAKRLIRDKIRYRDELQCAAARVIVAIRDLAREKDPKGNPEGLYDSFHIRRGDFAVRSTRVNAFSLYESAEDKLTRGRLVFVATDERKTDFLDELKQHFEHIVFLEEFTHLLGGVNSNLYNIIDQLVCSRGSVFFGTWASTFTAYIIRLRAYRAEKDRVTRRDDNGNYASYYFAPAERKHEMLSYSPITTFWMREFPAAWQDIDSGQDAS